MKKLYIIPNIEVELIEASSICAGSPKLDVDDYTGEDKKPDSDLDDKPTGGDLSDMAKQGGFFFDFDED